MLHRLLQYDVVIASAWLALSLFTLPILVSKAWERLGIPGKWWLVWPAIGLCIAAIAACYSAARILDNIHCERETHHPCEEGGDD
ncbi:MAG: hypothetical protein V4522_08090 [Pseudomonadota bacterium]|uniref:hypothetical protein n=1 Tax=unclassified Sphingomonas TaxID=196159 RepID=UPI00053D78D2|nr:hypothetical protein [Sphingomonas sp. Ant H11]